jgi:hypothetical protein
VSAGSRASRKARGKTLAMAERQKMAGETSPESSVTTQKHIQPNKHPRVERLPLQVVALLPIGNSLSELRSSSLNPPLGVRPAAAPNLPDQQWYLERSRWTTHLWWGPDHGGAVPRPVIVEQVKFCCPEEQRHVRLTVRSCVHSPSTRLPGDWATTSVLSMLCSRTHTETS